MLNESIRNHIHELYESSIKQVEQPTKTFVRDTPLVVRLKRLIESIPENERTLPRSLEWYRVRLQGRKKRCAHAGEVGKALRELGFIRKRDWSNGVDGFPMLWYPKS